MWFGERRGEVGGLDQVVVGPVVGPDVAGPHLQDDLERLFEAVEPLGDGWERDAEAEVLRFVPSGADTERRPATRKDVQGRDDLREKARMG